MNAARLKKNIIDSLWRVVDHHSAILSATLTGSFTRSDTLDGLSDIDFVVIVDELNQLRFDQLLTDFQSELEPVLASAGYRFMINPTLGPLKFNEADLAVLHLMFYSRDAHVDHVINSPFTCLDWQQSSTYRKASMASIYPTFSLQPRHFLSARRSLSDYLRDYRANVVSYRELNCDASGYTEKKCNKPMDLRDRHEFAYHVMRFLMLNLLKLIRRMDTAPADLDSLIRAYADVFPQGSEEASQLLNQLAEKKRRIDYDMPLDSLDSRLEFFIEQFERQFRTAFFEQATRHLLLRHAPTAYNLGPVRFLGRTDACIVEDAVPDSGWGEARQQIESLAAEKVYSSPLGRCKQTLEKLGPFPSPILTDPRLLEMDYGRCELMTVADARLQFTELFDDWKNGADPHFPGGENSASVLSRSLDFASDKLSFQNPSTVVCTHNVVLRELMGELLQVPRPQRFKIQIPHAAPIEVIATKSFGLLVNLSERIERQMFEGFIGGPKAVGLVH